MTDRRPVVPEGLDPQAIVPVSQGMDEGPSDGSATRRSIFGVLWCSIGSIFVPMVPVLSNVLVAFGAATVFGCGSRRVRVVAPLVALAACVAWTVLLFGVVSLPMSVLSIVTALALAWMQARGRTSTGGLLTAAAVATLAMIGSDVVSTSLQGTSVTELISKVVDEAVEANLAAVDLDGTAALLQTREELVAYWPTIYFVVGLGLALCSVLGARLGALVAGVPVEANPIVRYDVPLWVAELFAVGVAVQVLGPRIAPQADEVAMLGANVVMATRLALAQQGLSVLQWWTREHGLRPLLRVSLILVAVWLELSFALTSVAGLLDVVMNFRHLRRRRPDLVLRRAQER